MYSINDLKSGVTIEVSGSLYLVISSSHLKMGRSGGMMKTKLKNLESGSTIEKTFKGSEEIKPASLERRKAQYLYKNDSQFFFMDQEDFNQFNLGKKQIGDISLYIKEGDIINIKYFKNSPVDVEIPIKVKLKVIKAAKGIKGNTVSATTKSVTMETGLKVNVPLFVKENDILVVDTRNGSYVERAK